MLKHMPYCSCTPFGPVQAGDDGVPRCVFCHLADPEHNHFETHNYAICAARPSSERVFRRKDHLVQHLRLVHSKAAFTDGMRGWLTTVDAVRSRCGFCNTNMTSWAERDAHLAHHFKNGADMVDWEGDRGLDPEIERLVQDDMPAWLIGQQRRTTEPFSASLHQSRITTTTEVLGQEDSGVPQAEANLHSHRDVERQLLSYVSGEIVRGRVPSDAQLQKTCGLMMYGDDYDEEWEQTWADNAQWLARFKKKAGLINLPLSGGKNAFVGRDTL